MGNEKNGLEGADEPYCQTMDQTRKAVSHRPVLGRYVSPIERSTWLQTDGIRTWHTYHVFLPVISHAMKPENLENLSVRPGSLTCAVQRAVRSHPR